MMICKRCGTRCPERPHGYCFHCQIAVNLETALSVRAGKPMTLKDAGIKEGFPDYEKPHKGDRYDSPML